MISAINTPQSPQLFSLFYNNDSKIKDFFKTHDKINICGIYKITSPIGRIYIGQTNKLQRRFKRYRNLDCKGQTRLYRSFEKHGVENHTFEIIKYCYEEDLNFWEDFYVRGFKTFNSEHGLNLRSGGACSKMSEESRKKSSESHKGQKTSLGKKRTKEQREAQSKRMIGRKLTQEHKENISKSQIGKHSMTDSHKEKMSKIHTGKIVSDETREKQRIAHLGQIPTNKGIPMTDEQKKKMSIAATGRVKSEQNIINWKASYKANRAKNNE